MGSYGIWEDGGWLDDDINVGERVQKEKGRQWSSRGIKKGGSQGREKKKN